MNNLKKHENLEIAFDGVNSDIKERIKDLKKRINSNEKVQIALEARLEQAIEIYEYYSNAIENLYAEEQEND